MIDTWSLISKGNVISNMITIHSVAACCELCRHNSIYSVKVAWLCAKLRIPGTWTIFVKNNNLADFYTIA